MAATAAAGLLTRGAFGALTLRAPCSLTALKTRQCSSELATERDDKTERSPFRPAASTTHDWIGPPNPLSNIRPIVYHVPENESELERRLRHLRQETEDWNHDFWTKQNISFSQNLRVRTPESVSRVYSRGNASLFSPSQEKEEFIFSQLNRKGLKMRDEEGRRRSLSSEEMAVFYKRFLDTNRIRHGDYNREWYRRNFTITLLMARVALKQMWTTVTERYNRPPSSS